MPYEDRQALFLLRAVAEGEGRALTQLYRMTCGPTAAYLARLLPDRDSVEDILSETYVEVWRDAGTFDERSRVLTWIIGIARNLALSSLKRRRVHVPIDDLEFAAEEEDPLEHDDQRILLERALRALPAHQREILGLALVREFPYEQIAALLDIPLATVKTRVFYAKAALREQLLGIGVKRADVL